MNAPQLLQFDNGWIVAVPQPDGQVHKFRCDTEQQAKRFLGLVAQAAVPKAAPPPRPPAPKKRCFGRLSLRR